MNTNKIVMVFVFAFCLVAFSCSKIKVDNERINLVDIEKWCPARNLEPYTLKITGEAQYCFAKSNGIDDCLFMKLDARSSDEKGEDYFFLIGIDKDNIPFQKAATPSMKKLRNTPARIELINAFYGAEDVTFDILGDVENCKLTHTRDGIVAVSIEGKETYFFKIDSFVSQNIDRNLRDYLFK